MPNILEENFMFTSMSACTRILCRFDTRSTTPAEHRCRSQVLLCAPYSFLSKALWGIGGKESWSIACGCSTMRERIGKRFSALESPNCLMVMYPVASCRVHQESRAPVHACFATQLGYLIRRLFQQHRENTTPTVM